MELVETNVLNELFFFGQSAGKQQLKLSVPEKENESIPACLLHKLTLLQKRISPMLFSVI